MSNKITSMNDISIKNFFKDDILNFRNYPVSEVANYFSAPQKQVYMVDTSIITDDKKRKEYKDYLYCIFTRQEPFSYKSHKFSYSIYFAGYIASATWKSIFETTLDDEKEILDYFHSINKNCDVNTQRLIKRMKHTLVEFYDVREGLDRDIWHVKNMNLSKERINASGSTKSINFYSIKNVENRELIKIYFKYLIGGTETSFSTLVNYMTNFVKLCDFIKDKSLLDVEREDFLNFMNTQLDISANKRNKMVITFSDFYKYLAIKKIYKKQCPILSIDFIREKRKHYYNTVSDHVIFQIFNHLWEVPNDLLIMYLINYSTGMRVSDICQLQTDCLIRSEKCCFIRFHIQKMQKDHAVPVSTALGDLIEKRIQDLSKKNSIYLFPSPLDEDSPITTMTYSRNMKKWCAKWEIKNEDGTPYEFHSHAYRHTIATSLAQKDNVALEIIQLVILGHANVQMSLCYIDESDEYKKMLNDRYINNAGNYTSLENKQLTHPEWIKENLSKQVLPNGICSYPTILGVCPNADVCLNCEYFRTSKRYLDVHKQHLEKLETQIVTYKSNGWIHNLETALKQKEQLEKIISTLEE